MESMAERSDFEASELAGAESAEKGCRLQGNRALVTQTSETNSKDVCSVHPSFTQRRPPLQLHLIEIIVILAMLSSGHRLLQRTPSRLTPTSRATSSALRPASQTGDGAH